MSKDVATIVARALCRVHEYGETAGKGSTTYLKLLYTMLYAVPEKTLFEDMARYAYNGTVREHLQALCRVCERLASDWPSCRNKLREIHSLVWPDGAVNDEDAFLTSACVEDLTSLLCREPQWVGRGLDARALSDLLRWLVRLKEEWRAESEAGFPEERSPDFARELRAETDTRTASAVQTFDSVLNRLASHERALQDAQDVPETIVTAMRHTLDDLAVLRRLCHEHLPFAERHAILGGLDARRKQISDRLLSLTTVVDTRDEQAAERIVNGEGGDELEDSDRKVVARWMLDRFMLRELAVDRNPVLKLLLSPCAVILLILAPFLASAILNRFYPGKDLLLSLPFFAIILFNVGLLAAYPLCGAKLPGGLSRATLLLPQMVGTLFLGIMQSFHTDEMWTLGVLPNVWIRVSNILLFGGAAYFFVRYVMLASDGQISGNSNAVLRRRTFNVLALGLWQAFFLITLFTMLRGTLMGGPARADLASAIQTMDHATGAMGEWIPHDLKAELGFATVTIYPWAILTWTVQVFFFSAIFERLLDRRQA